MFPASRDLNTGLCRNKVGEKQEKYTVMEYVYNN